MDSPNFSQPPAPRKRRPIRRRVRWIDAAVPRAAWEHDFLFGLGPLPARLLAPIGVLAGSVGAMLLVDIDGHVVGVRGPSVTWRQMERELQRRTVLAGGRPA
jgi:hypothetical protein